MPSSPEKANERFVQTLHPYEPLDFANTAF